MPTAQIMAFVSATKYVAASLKAVLARRKHAEGVMKKLLLLWVVSLVLVSMATYAVAQTRPSAQPTVSGNDIGFRVDGTDSKGQPFGALLIRLNGEWVETGSTMTLRKLQ